MHAHRHGALAVQWGAVIAWVAVAKAFELADHAVFEATGQWVSGHTLKHLMAAGRPAGAVCHGAPAPQSLPRCTDAAPRHAEWRAPWLVTQQPTTQKSQEE